MVENLKGGTLWAVVAIVLGVLGAATYLASQSILSGSDWLVLGTAILASVGIVTGAHVAGNAVQTALNTPAPGTGPALLPATSPGAGPVEAPTEAPVTQPVVAPANN